MQKSYAAYSTEDSIRLRSSSGGFFSLCSEYVLQRGGVIYGVAMSEDCYVAEYIRVDNANDLKKLCGSKYLQANLGRTFQSVKKDLENDLVVLFSGTGCYVNGLETFLSKKYDNLICIDVVCHGVPSPKLWREYAKFQESKHGKLEQINFRAKEEGWKKFGMKENHLYIPREKDPFMNMFLDDFCLRPSCYKCRAKKYRLSDISIADFWGIENVTPEMNDGMGTSLIIVRTENGQNLFDSIKEKLNWKEVDYNEAIRENPAEYRSAIRPLQRDTFFSDLQSRSFNFMIRKYAPDTKKIRIRNLWRKAKRIVKKLCVGGVTPKTNSNYGMFFIFQS